MSDKIKKRNNTEGFTIIEILIVLAIAGLILLIVFLAVPALQRSARNTTIKNDATALAAGFSEYGSNNNGALPASPLPAMNGSAVTIGAVGTSQATANVSASTTVTLGKSTPPAVAAANSAGTLWWNTGTNCANVTNTRAIAVYYYVEASGGLGPRQCVDAS